MRVVVDTNALMMPIEADVRLFEELDRLLPAYETVVPEPVVEELEELSQGASEEATAANVGRDLAGRCTIVSTDAEYADDAVVELAADSDYVVTNDRPLRQRLLERDVPVICLRGRQKLGITEP